MIPADRWKLVEDHARAADATGYVMQFLRALGPSSIPTSPSAADTRLTPPARGSSAGAEGRRDLDPTCTGTKDCWECYGFSPREQAALEPLVARLGE